MATPVIMPRQGQSVESCIIGCWYKKVGDKVAPGDDLFSYETDKATFDASAEVEGEILALFFAEGDDVPCLTNVCVIGQKGEDFSVHDPNAASGATTPAGVAAPKSAAPAATPTAPVDAAPSAAPAAPGGVAVGISPRARGTARKHGVDLREVVATGPKGRVIERDIFRLIDEGKFATAAAGCDYPAGTAGSGIGGRVSVADLSAPPAASPAVAPAASFHEEKHSNIRKLIAKSMMQSLGGMAQLSYTMSFDASEILAFRARLKQARESGVAEKLGFTGKCRFDAVRF